MRKFALLISLLTAGCGQAQPPGGSDSPAPTPEAWIQALDQGKTIRDGDTLHAPAEIFMFLGVSSESKGGPGDHITIELMDNTNKLYSARCGWHKGIRPDPNSRNAQPMIVQLPGFDNADFTWNNPPVGSHVLTAHAFGLGDLSVTSAALHITVVSSP